MTRPIILYLRPFVADSLEIVHPGHFSLTSILLPFFGHSLPGTVPLEVYLAEEFDSLGVWLAIGEKCRTLGPGRMLPEDADWKKLFVRAAEEAACIVSVPSIHKSTFWELQWLREHQHAQKVVMLFTAAHVIETRSPNPFALELLTAELLRIGWQLPRNISDGSIVCFAQDGTAEHHKRKGAYRARVLRCVLQGVAEKFSLG